MKKYLTIISLVIGSAALVLPGSASALSGSEFQPGRIIDDAVFFDKSSMNVQQIQDFLNSKVTTCDTNGDQAYYGYYGGRQHNGDVLRRNLDPNYPSPYTCLRQYIENTTTRENNIGRPSANILGGISAAQIIYNEAQNYGISPKVLLVLLQKESSLVTDDWPWSNQYRSATGYGCPDTAACDSQYYGFYNQVHNAARQYRIYTDHPSSYNYGIGSNTIAYNPNGSCGSAQVNIVNQATANLYNYTPYVPNAAALNNLYGTGDSCSAYGNRNFWRLYSDWFGTTQAAAYSSQYYSQCSWPIITQGESASCWLEYRNSGNQTWYDDTSATAGRLPVHLSTSRPTNRNSQFAGGNWGRDNNRPAVTFAAVYESDGTTLAADQHVVQAGQIAKFTFTFTVSAAVAPGSYQEYFRPILEGSIDGSFNDPGTWLMVGVAKTTYLSQYFDQCSWPIIAQGGSSDCWLRYKNTGNQTWYDDANVPAGQLPVHLATTSPLDRRSVFGGGWGSGGNRPTTSFAAVYESDGTTLAANQHVAQPGQVAKFAFTFTASPSTAPDSYHEYFQPVLEGAPAAMNNPGTWLLATVTRATFATQYFSQCNWPTVTPGGTANCWIEYTNAGNQAWYDDTSATGGKLPMHLSTGRPTNRTSIFAGSNWGRDGNRPAYTFAAVYEANGTTLAANQYVVQPGQVAKFAFTFTAPAGAAAGSYQEYFRPIIEGTANGATNDPGTWLMVTVPGSR
jgi:hypothetical protein